MLLAEKCRDVDARTKPVPGELTARQGQRRICRESHTDVVFLGGIHGVGKTTYCRTLAPLLGLQHLTAGDLIREIDASQIDKTVADIDKNQARLIAALNARTRGGERVLLDGHFCLIDSSLAIVPVSIDVFRRIEPTRILVMEADLREVETRLRQRDGKGFDLALLEALAMAEREHATSISLGLRIPLKMINADTRLDEVQSFLA